MKITETEATMYTVAEAASRIQMTERNFRYCYQNLGVPNVRIGHRILIPIKAFEAWRRDKMPQVVMQGD